MGNLEVGEPTVTTSLRGEVSCIVTVSTLRHALHSGVFGGPAPDAMIALARLLSTLHDDEGNVAVDGVSGADWSGMEPSEGGFRTGADLLDGSALIGTGSIGSRLWSRPSISAIGIDTTSIEGSSNVLLPSARAKLSMRIAPDSDPDHELDALVHHLESHVPWGAAVEVERVKSAPAFRCADRTDPAHAAARAALEEAFGKPAGRGRFGRIDPAPADAARVNPDAEFILWGAEDMARARDPLVRRERRPDRDRADDPRPGPLPASLRGRRRVTTGLDVTAGVSQPILM